MPAVRKIFIYDAFKLMTAKRPLKGLRPETLEQAPRKILPALCRAYLKSPSWGGLFVLAIAQRSEVEELARLYHFAASPSEILELLGEGAKAKIKNPVIGARDLLRVKWRGLFREYDREAVVAFLAANPVDVVEQIDAKTLLTRLTEEELLLVNLLYLKGLTQEEAGKVLDIAPRTIRASLLEIKKKIGPLE